MERSRFTLPELLSGAARAACSRAYSLSEGHRATLAGAIALLHVGFVLAVVVLNLVGWATGAVDPTVREGPFWVNIWASAVAGLLLQTLYVASMTAVAALAYVRLVGGGGESPGHVEVEPPSAMLSV